MNRFAKMLIAVTLLTLFLTSCGGGGASNFATNFPLPSNVSNFTGEGGDAQINFSTSLNLDEVVEFYRDAFGSQGLTERTITTSITETAASLVFDGHASGQAIVVQAVDLGNGTTNVNVRLEAI